MSRRRPRRSPPSPPRSRGLPARLGKPPLPPDDRRVPRIGSAEGCTIPSARLPFQILSCPFLSLRICHAAPRPEGLLRSKSLKGRSRTREPAPAGASFEARCLRQRAPHTKVPVAGHGWSFRAQWVGGPPVATQDEGGGNAPMPSTPPWELRSDVTPKRLVVLRPSCRARAWKSAPLGKRTTPQGARSAASWSIRFGRLPRLVTRAG
jgi:hypothetical protein